MKNGGEVDGAKKVNEFEYETLVFRYRFHKANRGTCTSASIPGTSSIPTCSTFMDGILDISLVPTTTLIFRDIPRYITPQEMCRFLCLEEEENPPEDTRCHIRPRVWHVAVVQSSTSGGVGALNDDRQPNLREGNQSSGLSYAILMRVAHPCDAEYFFREYNGAVVTSISGSEVLRIYYAKDDIPKMSTAREAVQPFENISREGSLLDGTTSQLIHGLPRCSSIIPFQPRYEVLVEQSVTLGESGGSGNPLAGSQDGVLECPVSTASPCSAPGRTVHPHSCTVTCSVCLEAITASPNQRYTIFTSDCMHHLHLSCFLSLPDAHCPLCRHNIASADTSCSICDCKESLYMCLVCGFVGCGPLFTRPEADTTAERRQWTAASDSFDECGYHATQHYDETGHSYAIEIATQVAWDFASSSAIHRVIAHEQGSDIAPERNAEQMVHLAERLRNEEQVWKIQEKSRQDISSSYARLLESQLITQERHYRAQSHAVLEQWTIATLVHEEILNRDTICNNHLQTLLDDVVLPLRQQRRGLLQGLQKRCDEIDAAVLLEQERLRSTRASRDRYRTLLTHTKNKRETAQADSECDEIRQLEGELDAFYSKLES